MSPELEKNLKYGIVFGMVIAGLIVFAIVKRDGDQFQDAVRVREGAEHRACVQRGVKYFKDVGSYPKLSDGRDAESTAQEKCSKTTTSF